MQSNSKDARRCRLVLKESTRVTRAYNPLRGNSGGMSKKKKKKTTSREQKYTRRVFSASARAFIV